MKEWLTVIIVLLIVAVVLDAIRRMRQSRRSALRMSLNVHQKTSVDDETEYGSELPNGGARIVTVNKAEIRSEADELDLSEEVPMLMESVGQIKTAQRTEKDPIQPTEDAKTSAVDVTDNRDPAAVQNSFDFGNGERIEPSFSEIGTDDLDKPPRKATVPASTAEQPKKNKTDTATAHSKDDYAEPELVLVVNVMAPEGQKFSGDALLEILLAQGLRYGAMNIFHAHSNVDGSGPVKFSMANMVVPGTFDLTNMSEFSTPGVSFFLTLPIETSSRRAYEDMLRSAKALADRLGGELKDENRVRLTAQAIEHNRSRIAEFERKQLSRAH